MARRGGTWYNNAMLRRVAGFSVAEICFFLLSLIYLLAEFRFNVVLLDAAGSATVDDLELERAADFGRLVSGFGFTLLALGLFTTARFRLTRARERIVFAVFAALCLAPFIFFPPAEHEFLFIIPVVFGLFVMIVSRGRFAFHTILAVVLMAWPAMYAGQKSMIEHLVVEPTSWQERAHARNALLLKAGLENCIVEVDDQWLCKGDKSTAEIRAIRAMITALWMHNPDAITASLTAQRDTIIERSAQKDEATLIKAYQAYKKDVEDRRSKVVDEMVAQLYEPYLEASKIYQQTQDPQKLRLQVTTIWREMEAETDIVWDQYRHAQRQYQQTVGRISNNVLRREGLAFETVDEFCASRNCPGRGIADKAALRLTDEAETQFIRKTGFPPNVADKRELFSYPRARDRFEDVFNKRLGEKFKLPGAVLPENWVYEESYMKALLESLLRNQAALQWQQKFGENVAPGLPMAEFFTRMSIPPVPAMDKLVMSPDAFAEKYTLPQLRRQMHSSAERMEKEAPLYANGESLENEGRGYIRAVYIPAIALLLSLLIVSLTLLRGLNAGLRHGLQAAGQNGNRWLAHRGLNGQRRMRRATMAVIAGVFFLGPFLLSNSYTQSPTYHVYVAQARAENTVTATLLDWAIHVQPVIYTLVQPFME